MAGNGCTRVKERLKCQQKGSIQAMFEVDEEHSKRERRKARELRQSQWWKNRVARGECHYCQARVLPAELTLDHVVPVSRGGKSSKGNCVAACKTCNSQKKQLTPVEWSDYMDRIS